MTSNDLKDRLLKDIQKTGFPFEMETSSIFQRRGWRVSNGSYYIDKDENRGREIDIIAQIHKNKNIFDNVTLEVVFSLIIEIKKSEEKPWIFFTSEKSLVERLLPKEYVHSGFNSKGSDLNRALRKHTVKAKNRIGRNFYQGFTGNGARDDIYKALLGTTKALNHFKETSYYKDNNSGDRLFNYFEPIIVIKGKIFEAYVNDDGTTELEESNYIQTKFNYLSPHYSQSNENVVHIVTDTFLEEFIIKRKEALYSFFDDLISNKIY